MIRRRESLLFITFIAAILPLTHQGSPACARGLFSLERNARKTRIVGSASVSPSPASTDVPLTIDGGKLNGSECVISCPIGFYHAISFTNEPSFNDLNSGSADSQTVLKCAPCLPECSFCLGPERYNCFVCSPEWERTHNASFITAREWAVGTASPRLNDSDCKIWDRIQKLQKQSVIGWSVPLSLAVVLISVMAVFCAALVFSAYVLQMQGGTPLITIILTPFYWLSDLVQRRRYSSISTMDTQMRDMYTKPMEETVAFRGGLRSTPLVVSAGDEEDSDF